jgi:hypothetical protein
LPPIADIFADLQIDNNLLLLDILHDELFYTIIFADVWNSYGWGARCNYDIR